MKITLTIYTNDNVVIQVKITAPGCSRFISGWYQYTGVPMSEIEHISLNRVKFNYQSSIINEVISSEMSYLSWNYVDIHDVLILPAGNLNVKCRSEILINKEFYAVDGCESHFQLGETFFSCDANISDEFDRMISIGSDRIGASYPEGIIEVSFNTLPTPIDVKIYPNPCSNTITITNSRENYNENLELTIFDSNYRQLLDVFLNKGITTLDVSSLLNGVYTFLFKYHDETFFQKVVVLK